MPYGIRYSNEAVDQLRTLRNFDRTAILDQIEEVLTVNPTLVSKARIKRLGKIRASIGIASTNSGSSITWKKKPSSSSRSTTSRIPRITSEDHHDRTARQ